MDRWMDGCDCLPSYVCDVQEARGATAAVPVRLVLAVEGGLARFGLCSWAIDLRQWLLYLGIVM